MAIKKQLFLALTLTAALSCLAWAGTGIGPTEDPTKIGVGARVMGMGKANVGLADDGSAVFVNPSGIADLSSWNFLSMYCNLLDDVPYQVASLSYPFTLGGLKCGWGIGYIGSGVYDIITTSQSGFLYSNYHNNVYSLSLAAKISQTLSTGLSFKVFDEGFNGNTNANASGMDMDLGVKYAIRDWATLGATLQNFLPASLGGVVKWEDTGHEESVPSLLKVGSSFLFFQDKLKLALDGDVWVNRKLPPQYHLGLEWKVFPLLLLRGGIDQTLSSAHGGSYSNPTFGLGLNLWSFRFDYAYHHYYDFSENVSHFFSLSYSPAATEERKEVFEKTPWLLVIHPKDKTIMTKRKIVVFALVKDKNVAEVRINDEITRINESSFVEKEMELRPGKNLLLFEGYNVAGERIDIEKARVVSLVSFNDLREDFWAKEAIEYLATAGVLKGYKDGGFKPDYPITRAEMVVLLMRMSGDELPPARKMVFKDVPARFWAAPAITAAVSANIIFGYEDGRFRPNQYVSRAEAIQMIAKFDKLEIPGFFEKQPYYDTMLSHWATPSIVAAKQHGLLSHVVGRFLMPGQNITRAEVSEILSKTMKGREIISEFTFAPGL
ncbi:MAG: S-layer homology domain-containing protein [Candidatus Margulisiibacteriota bacterium]